MGNGQEAAAETTKVSKVAKVAKMEKVAKVAETAPGTSISRAGKGRGEREGEVSVERAVACVKELYHSLSRLHSKGLFPYNPSPLLKR